MSGTIIKVGMADLKLCMPPDGVTTLGLGSCVGIALRDPKTLVGGLAHIMLPDSTMMKNNTNIYKFADTGINELLRLMTAKGAMKDRVVAKIAGGAQMFSFKGDSDAARVGERNVEATKAHLKKLGIPILAEDTGKNYGRTVIFYPATGAYVIKAIGKPERTI